MVKKIKQTSINKIKAYDYKIIAQNFHDGAKVAAEFEYWNAAGVLIVHSAIAYGDAITIKFGGVKSKGEDHHNIIGLINSVIADSHEKRKALTQLSNVLDHKNMVSYSGNIYYRKDIEKLEKYLERFQIWAEKILK